jgi:hypothetical protein
MSFQTTIIIVAGLLLVVILILIGVAMSKSKEEWPSVIGQCPDYWIDLSGNGVRCVNVKDLGTCNGSVPQGNHLTMDFSISPYTGSNGTCSKYNWATNCGVTWDGITEGVPNPCDSTSSSS